MRARTGVGTKKKSALSSFTACFVFLSPQSYRSRSFRWRSTSLMMITDCDTQIYDQSRYSCHCGQHGWFVLITITWFSMWQFPMIYHNMTPRWSKRTMAPCFINYHSQCGLIKQNPKRKGNILNEQTRHRPLTIVAIIVPWIEKFQNKTDSAFTQNSYANSPNWLRCFTLNDSRTDLLSMQNLSCYDSMNFLAYDFRFTYSKFTSVAQIRIIRVLLIFWCLKLLGWKFQEKITFG